MTGEQEVITQTAGSLALVVGGQVCGDPETRVRGCASLSTAGEGQVSFIDSARWVDRALESRASVLFCVEGVAVPGKTLILVQNPKLAFAKALAVFHPIPIPNKGVHPQSDVHPTAHLGQDIAIGPFCYVGPGARLGDRSILMPGVFVGAECSIGEGCLLHHRVTLYPRVTLGDRVIIHAGSVIGCDGFGYVLDDGIQHKIPQVGGVTFGNDVEIGANTTIDGGTLDPTVIGSYIKIDNGVQIGHNVTIGEKSMLSAQVGVAGSSIIGKGVVIGGQAGIGDHTNIGDGAMIGAKSGVLTGKTVVPGAVVWGMPSRHIDKIKTQMAAVARLPGLFDEVTQLRKRIEELERDRG